MKGVPLLRNQEIIPRVITALTRAICRGRDGDLQEFYIFGVIELPRANLMTRNDIVFMGALVWLGLAERRVVGLLN